MKSKSDVAQMAREALAQMPLMDLHTHLFDPAFGELCLWGIDELLTYHYLVAEVFRARPDLDVESFWKLTKTVQADLIWEELFIKRSPISEACRGVVTVVQRLGLDPRRDGLAGIRRYFAGQTARGYIDTVFGLANISEVIMTNDPLHDGERAVWQKGFDRDPRFRAALRLDSALMNWPEGAERLAGLGYDVRADLSGPTLAGVRRYLSDWVQKMDACYMAISLPPTFRHPDSTSPLIQLLTKAVIPVARECGIPVALMIGVRKLVNPALRLAGDSVGPADVSAVESLALEFPDVRFLVTFLSRENTHALCVAARKFRNLLPFGCWWFLNNPSLIREMTAMRLELLGLGFTPQHSDCRVLDQLVYKWDHSRRLIGEVLGDKYADLARSGWVAEPGEILRDAARLLPPAWQKAGSR
jgi:hypothetical protein